MGIGSIFNCIKQIILLRKFKRKNIRSSLVAQWVKDPVLSLQWLGLVPCHGFDPWPGDFHVPQVWPEKKKKKKKKKTAFRGFHSISVGICGGAKK